MTGEILEDRKAWEDAFVEAMRTYAPGSTLVFEWADSGTLRMYLNAVTQKGEVCTGRLFVTQIERTSTRMSIPDAAVVYSQVWMHNFNTALKGKNTTIDQVQFIGGDLARALRGKTSQRTC